MPWFERWRRPSETGDEQLARLQRATPERPVPAGPPADQATQLAHLRHILDLLWHYFPGTTYGAIAEARGTPDRPLTARRVGLLHQAEPTDLADSTGEELVQIAGIALRRPGRLATDPDVVAGAAANLDLLHALDACRRQLGMLPAIRPDPDLATPRGIHAYAARLRREVARRQRDILQLDPWYLHWGRRGDGPPGPPELPPPYPREEVIDDIALLIALMRTMGERAELGGVERPGTTAWAQATNATSGWCYHMRGRGGSVHRPAYLSDAELDEALRRAEERLALQPLAAP